MLDSYTREHVGDLVERPPVTVDTDTTLRAAAATMFRENVGLVVVTEHGEPIGVASERDIVSAIAQDADPDARAVSESATKFIVTAEAHDTLLDATLQMVDSGTRHVVVDHAGKIIGVLSIRDLMIPVLLQALGMTPDEQTLPSATEAQIWWRVTTD